MYKKTTGFILRKKQLGEADSLLIIFSDKLGKIKALAKGITKTYSKKAGHLDLLMLSDLELRENKAYDYIIKEAKAINNFPILRSNLTKTLIAFHLTELIDKTTPWGETNEKIFSLLKNSFDFLERVKYTKRKDLIYFILLFKLNLIKLLGVRPKLNICLVCQKKISSKEKAYFSPQKGGIVCSICQTPYSKESIELDKELIDQLTKMEDGKSENLYLFREENFKKISQIIDFYIKLISEKDLQSTQIIKKIKSSLREKEKIN